MYEYQAGATGKTIDVMIRRLDTGAGYTGLAYNSSGLVARYKRTRAAPVAITLATLGSVSASWSSGGFIEIDATNEPGLYRFDVPDAALVSGVPYVLIGFSGTVSAVALRGEQAKIDLRSFDPHADGTRATVDANGRVTTTDTDAFFAGTVSGTPTSSGFTLASGPATVPVGTVYADLFNGSGVAVAKGWCTLAGTAVTFSPTLSAAPTTATTVTLRNAPADASLASDTTIAAIAAGVSSLDGTKLTTGRAGNLDHLNADVSGVAAAAVTALKADADWKKLRAVAVGTFTYTPPVGGGAGTGTLVLKDTDNTTTLATLTLTIDANLNVTARA